MEFPLEIPQDHSIERLDAERHNREGFSCGTKALDEFLRTQARQSQDRNFTITHVLVRSDEQATDSELRSILGYVSLTQAHMPLADMSPSIRTTKKDLPLLHLVRMAVDQRHQRKRYGVLLLRFALKCAWDLDRIAGCYAIIVDAKEDAKAFYIKHGFEAMGEAQSRLYLTMGTIKKVAILGSNAEQQH